VQPALTKVKLDQKSLKGAPMSETSSFKFSVTKKELRDLFKQIIFYELVHEYLSGQKIEDRKKGFWGKKLSAYFTEEERGQVNKEAKQFLNEYLDWLQLEELDWLASQESEVLEEVLAEEDRLDYSATEIFDKVNRRLESQKNDMFSFLKLKRRDN